MWDDGLRLNPGNIGGPDRIKAVVKAARERQIPIRIGVNAGSLPKDIDPALPTSEKMVIAAMREISLFEESGFDLIKISLKASDVPATIESYQKIATLVPYPCISASRRLEALRLASSAVRWNRPVVVPGIGDTIRVSLPLHR